MSEEGLLLTLRPVITQLVEYTVAECGWPDVPVGLTDDEGYLGVTLYSVEGTKALMRIKVNATSVIAVAAIQCGMRTHEDMKGDLTRLGQEIRKCSIEVGRHEAAHVAIGMQIHARSEELALNAITDAERLLPDREFGEAYSGHFLKARTRIATGEWSDHGSEWQKVARKYGAEPRAHPKFGL